jgi:hypothetical protein
MDLEKVGLWVSAPFMMLTADSPRKWVRVVGVLTIVPLLPLTVIGCLILMLAMVRDMYKEI